MDFYPLKCFLEFDTLSFYEVGLFLRSWFVSTKLDCFYVGTVVSTCAALYGRTCLVDMNFGCFYEVGLFLSFSVVSTKKNCFLELCCF